MSKILSAPTLPKEKLTLPLPEEFKIHLLIYNFTRSRLFAIIVLHNLFLILFGIFANVDCQILSLQRSIYLSPQSEGRLLFGRLVYRAEEQKEFLRGKRKKGKRGVSGNDPTRLLLRGEKGPGKK